MYHEKRSTTPRYEMSPLDESRIVEFFQKFHRDFAYCGEVAVHVRHNLDWTIWALDELAHRGVVVGLTDEEKKRRDLELCACVFRITDTK